MVSGLIGRSFKRLSRHSKESGRLPNSDALLHHPGHPSVPQDVSRDSFESSRLSCTRPRAVRVLDGAAFIMANNLRAGTIYSFPAPQMAKNFGAGPDRRRTLPCISRARART
jgi:hypothetical protein